MIFDTISYYDSSNTLQEVALSLPNLASRGNSRWVYTPASHAPGTCKVLWAVPPETGIAIPFKSRCMLYAGRTSSSGAANSFSGGTIIFQGRRTDNQGSASSSKVSTEITLSDAWWDLQKVTFQNQWNEITGGSVGSPTYTQVSWPNVILFQPAPGVTYSPAAVNNTISTWQQIEAVVAYAAAFATGADEVEIQTTSSAEFQPVYCNWYPVTSAKCAEVLQISLRSHPGVFTEMDYTTTPPTLHFRNRSTMTAVTLPYAYTDDNGITHLASDIQSLDELVPDAVRLYYKINNTIDGQPIIGFATDFWPVSAPNSLLCLDYSIDITGSTSVQVEYNFTSAAFNPASLALWQTKVNSLKSISQGGQIPNAGSAGALAIVDTTVNGGLSGHPSGLQVVDDTNTAINYTGTYLYYTDQDVYAWMEGASVVHANVVGFFSYQKNTGGALNLTPQITSHSHSMRLKLTNVPSGLYFYSQTVNEGESVPANLAQYIYTELSDLQYKLTHEIIQTAATASDVPLLIKPGKHCINLAGTNPLTGVSAPAAWATMNAVPERVTIEFFRDAQGLLVAKHDISCGPVNHLEPSALVALSNLFWNRQRLPTDLNQRLTGETSSNITDLSSEAARENSVPANTDYGINPIYAADATNTGYSNVVQPDATLGQITVQQLNSSTGAVVTAGVIPPVYNGSGAPASGTLVANAYYRIGFLYIDTSVTPNNFWRCTTAGSNTASVWTQIGGGGSGTAAQVFSLVSDGGDYWVVQAASAQVTQNIIKPSLLWTSVTGRTIRSVTYSYTYTAITVSGVIGYYVRSVSGSDGSAETNYVIPDPISGDTIFAMPAPAVLGTTFVPLTVLSATLVNAGSGYSANQLLNLTTGAGTVAKIKVLSIGTGGIIATFTMYTPGAYTSAPTLSGCGVTVGAATFNLTLAPSLVDMNIDGRFWAK